MFELAELEEAAASGETRFVICQNMDAQAEDEEVQVCAAVATDIISFVNLANVKGSVGPSSS